MKYTITLDEQEWNIVLGALQELPARIANPLTNNIQMQAVAQQTKAVEPGTDRDEEVIAGLTD